jgi:hypothetical protein
MHNDVLTNPQEAQLVVQLAGALLKAGLPAEELGVVSPYRAQVGTCNAGRLLSSRTTSTSRSKAAAASIVHANVLSLLKPTRCKA